VTAETPRTAAAGTSLVRAHLEIVKPQVAEAEKRIPLRFNPAEYQLKKSQTLAEIGIPGLPSPPLQWVRGGAEVLSFDALVDSTDTMRDVDEAYVGRIRRLLDPNEQLHAPPIVAFVWGRRRFVGVLEGLSIGYTLFDQEGHPLRAKLSVSLKEYRPAATQMIEHPRSSPDVEKTYLVRRGDTLPSIANAVFRDPGRWRELALANGLSDPRELRPGDRLLVPRLR
jgi:nucleoid-associated protein YgaU